MHAHKKLILKTAFISLWVIIVLALSLFGILSYCSPISMMKLSASVGLDSASGDYAYEEYVRSGNIEYLARAFEIAAEGARDAKANERFELLRVHEGFDGYCDQVDELLKESAGDSAVYGYRAYVFGQAAQVKYRLASGDSAKAEVAEFALSETEKSFPAGNPFLALSLEAAKADDASFCATLLEMIQEGGFPEDNVAYINIVKILTRIASKAAIA